MMLATIGTLFLASALLGGGLGAIGGTAPTLTATAQSGPWRAVTKTFAGTNLSGATGVTINGVACTVTGSTSTSVTVTTPTFSANGGPYNVVATTPSGNSGTSGNGIYTVAGDYLDIASAKVLFCIDPAVGITSTTVTDAVNGHVFTATTVTVDSSGINGQERLVMPYSANNNLTCTGLTSSATKAQGIAIGIVGPDIVNGLWNVGAGASSYINFSGNVYDCFGSTVRYGPTANGLSSGSTFAYQVKADASGNWTQRMNGSVIATNTGNTVGWAPDQHAASSNSGYPMSTELDFMLVLQDNLSTAEQTMMNAYCLARWGVTI